MKRNKRTFFPTLVCSLVLALAFGLTVHAEESAGGTGAGTETSPEMGVSVTLDKTTLELFVGDTGTVTAAVKVDGVEEADAAVIYTSDTPEVVTIENTVTGTLSAKKVGTAKIVAVYTVEGTTTKTSEACVVTVKEKTEVKPEDAVPVTGITINQSAVENQEVGGAGQTLQATVYPSDATNKTITWKSSDTSIATVDSTGLVKGVAPGKVTITATAGEKSDTVDVQVSGLTLTDSTELLVGRGETLTWGRYGDAEGLAIEWSSSNISVAGVKEGKVSAYNPGTTVITAKAGKYKVTCTVTVKEDVADAVNQSITAGEILAFADILNASDGLNARARKQIGADLEYLTGLSVPTSQGILYYGYSSPDVPGSGVGGVEKYYVGAGSAQRDITDVYFVPASGFGGTAVISYTGYGEGQSFNGSVRVAVQTTGDVAYSTAEERVLHFSSTDFGEVCRAKTGRTLRSITFTQPSPSKGTLYHNYSPIGQYSPPVSGDTPYYVFGGNRLLDEVSFLPAEGFTGTVTIPYVGEDSSGGTYVGEISIIVYAIDGAGTSSGTGSSSISYETAAGYAVSFDAEDFNDACIDAVDSRLNYVYFSLPSASQGVLNYGSSSEVSSTTRYFRSSSPKIDDIEFEPEDDFSGTATIPFTGYAVSGDRFEGEVIVRVGQGGSGVVEYTTSAGRAVDFNGLDFNEACQQASGTSLSSVSFELPSSSKGVLYYNYTNSSSTGSKVSENASYSKSRLSNITFVPKSGFTGVVTIPFTGKDSEGDRFSGWVEITVTGSYGSDTIRYSVISGGKVAFDPSDFNEISQDMTGDDLNYVRFTIPTQKYGALYHNYDSGTGTGNEVSASASYYRSGNSRLLKDVVFAADSSYTGTVELEYTGVSTGGQEFEGIVEISVTKPVNPVVSYTGSALPIKFSGADFQKACGSALPQGLSYIRFDALPSAIYGTLRVNFSGPNTGRLVTLNDTFYGTGMNSIDDVAFLAKPGYQGNVSLPFTAVDLQGNTVSGTVRVGVSTDYLKGYFLDTSRYSWAAPSIEFLYYCDITSGYGNGNYGPADNIRRGDYIVMLCRVFGVEPQTGASYSDISEGDYYAGYVAAAKEMGFAQEIGDGTFRPSWAVSRQDAVYMLYRAMRATGKNVSTPSVAILSAYSDGDQVSSEAKSAMAAMIQMGMITGDDVGNLNPHNVLNRAEMAVILHKALLL